MHSDCPPPPVAEGNRSHSDGINLPEWMQAHRAHQQTKHGRCISNSLAHDVFGNNKQLDHNMNHKNKVSNFSGHQLPQNQNKSSDQMRNSMCSKLRTQHSNRPDALIHLRKSSCNKTHPIRRASLFLKARHTSQRATRLASFCFVRLATEKTLPTRRTTPCVHSQRGL